jgi:hypothetical protein
MIKGAEPLMKETSQKLRPYALNSERNLSEGVAFPMIITN